jgi:hypothetical protein
MRLGNRLGLVAAVAFASWVSPARAADATRDKLAALILKTGDVDQELADNLTEVLIARIAAKHAGQMALVGKEKLRAQMGGDERRALDCTSQTSCLGQIGVELGVTRIVVGTLGKRGGDYLYNLTLLDIGTGRVENRIFELVAGKVDALIGAVQATADRLFEPKVEPGAVRVRSQVPSAMVYLDDAFLGSTPIRRDGIEAGPHRLRVEKEGHRGWANSIEVPAGSTLEITVPLSSLPARRRWPTALVAVTGPLALASGVVGLVFGLLSRQAPTGMQTRVDALADVDARSKQAGAANALFIATGALALTAVITMIAARSDIFGERTPSTSAAVTGGRSWVRDLAAGRF